MGVADVLEWYMSFIHFLNSLFKTGRSGKLNEDILVLTNYRLFLSLNNETSFINFPIMLIDTIEVKEIFYIHVYLKNIKTIK